MAMDDIHSSQAVASTAFSTASCLLRPETFVPAKSPTSSDEIGEDGLDRPPKQSKSLEMAV
jgi:hypothetical protein